jgi:FixJ family two-component response regulator
MSKRPLITVVDDDQSVRESLPDLLWEFGFEARAFSSADEFLDWEFVDQTNCPVLDVAMPGRTGPDLQRELTLRRSEIPIVSQINANNAKLLYNPWPLPFMLLAMSQTTPTVFIVDDDISVRESLEALVRFEGWQVETFASGQDFLARPRTPSPSCLVLDVSLPDLNGLDLQTAVAADRREMPIIFVTGYGDVPMTVRAMKAGAIEFLTKPVNPEVLLNAIRNALERSSATLDQESEIQVLRDRYASLSPREREVMSLVVSGLANKQVGFKLGISEITVKAHRGKVMRKMNVDSLADLVRSSVRLSSERSKSPAQNKTAAVAT